MNIYKFYFDYDFLFMKIFKYFIWCIRTILLWIVYFIKMSTILKYYTFNNVDDHFNLL
jgi:hypothetical protein